MHRGKGARPHSPQHGKRTVTSQKVARALLSALPPEPDGDAGEDRTTHEETKVLAASDGEGCSLSEARSPGNTVATVTSNNQNVTTNQRLSLRQA